MQDRILHIVKDAFSALITKIEGDFIANFKAKQHNFLLRELDTMMTAHMVFVSSFESKSGNAIQKVAREIAKLRYGAANVPSIINPHNIPHNLHIDADHEQVIITNIAIEHPDLAAAIESFMVSHKADRETRKPCSVNHQTILELLALTLPISSALHIKPVDLAFFDGRELNIMEIKAGGDLDSSNAPANARKLLKIYTGLNYRNTKPYFATIYHKDGEGMTWSGGIKKYLQYPNMFLIGSAFWSKILPAGITFQDFTQIYNRAISQINLNDRLNEMIRNCS